MKQVTGIWIRTSKKSGKKFMTFGKDVISLIQQLDNDRDDLLIFKNEKKQGERDPDYQLVVVEKRQPQQRRAPPSQQTEDESFGW